ncbi:amino-acid N-acetyltransferase [Saccharophagus degradans]|uniref:amino-acid N-acetyltransferase n=1 Tax=Saccharophagus degradans TaxID=86304 RepID=UPI002478067C|nr:amino-acid N-acetyltransferase [Saccharophagus degradans]WGO98229.1 amino-acid N-acetyltransferase [Saccharophagus degradans]
MSEHTDQYVNWFRASSPYINAHRGKTFVIMLPGDCIDQPNFPNIISDIALLNSLGVKLVVVHGARTQIEAQLNASGVQSKFHRGVRITEREHLADVLKAVGQTRFTLEANLSSGLPNSPMHGSKIRIRGGNFITAMPQGVIDGIDHHLTGKVRSVDTKGVREQLDEGSITLVSPLGNSFTGEVFNLSFADVAIHIATAIQADKLIAYNDDGPICDKDGGRYRELTLIKCEKFLVDQGQNNTSNTYFSLRACYKACDGGVPRAHVISAAEDGALLKELFTRDGSGTMVYRDSYETIRRARIEDVLGILNLIEPLENEGILVKRSRERLETEIDFFTVMEKDNLIIGCSALYPIEDENFAEIACVAIHPAYQRGGRAAKLLSHLEKQAEGAKLKRLLVLTTQTSHWFVEQGFVEGHIDMLPLKRKELYNYHRNSKIFIKNL